MAAISIIPKNNKKDKKGTLPLYLRITTGSTIRYLSLNLRIHETEWNKRTQSVRKTNPEHANLNKYLYSIQTRAQGIVADILASDEKISASKIRDRLKNALNKKQEEYKEDFIQYCNQILEDYRLRGQIATFKSYRTAVYQLEKFNSHKYGRKEIEFGGCYRRFAKRISDLLN